MIDPKPQELKDAEKVVLGSDTLLDALWREHPGIIADFIKKQAQRAAQQGAQHG